MSVAPNPGPSTDSAVADPRPMAEDPVKTGASGTDQGSLGKRGSTGVTKDNGRMRTGRNSRTDQDTDLAGDSADKRIGAGKAAKKAPRRKPASSRSDPRGLTRADEVRAVLEEDIFTGRLRPGTRMDEESLAQRFNISRTPIREAIMQLVHVGLVEKQPRHGAVVAQLKLYRMVQMFEVLSEIEGLCARYAARRMSEEERQNLRDLHDQSRQLVEQRDLDRYYAVNRNLHELIRAGSHNEPLQEIAHGLATRLAPYRRFQLNHPSRLEESYEEHVALVDAILAGDPDGAYAAMRRHVTIQIDIFAEFVSIMGGSAAD